MAMYIWDDTDKDFIAWDGTIVASDIQIGAVEIKDGDSDTRLDVETDGTKNAAYVQANDLDVAAAIKTAVEIMDDWDESDRAKVNVIAGQAGIAGGTGTDGATVPRVTLATNVALPSGSNTIGDVSVTTVKPDGTNTMPSLDASARAGYMKITDGSDDAAVETLSADTHDIDGLTGVVTASQMFARMDDDTIKGVRMDASTHAIETISYPHHEIHGGSMFEYTEVVDLPINNVWDIQITTPNTTKWAHMIIQFDTESETEWWFWENVTINTGGTAITEYNCNRNSATTATTALASITNTTLANANADTAVASATQLMHGISGAGKTRGGAGPDRDEIILKQNEDYSLRFEATVAGYVSVHITYYEHTSKN
jgi:hypothetical protein